MLELLNSTIIIFKAHPDMAATVISADHGWLHFIDSAETKLPCEGPEKHDFYLFAGLALCSAIDY